MLRRLHHWLERWQTMPMDSWSGIRWSLWKQFAPRWLDRALWWVRWRTTHRFDRIYIPTLKPRYHNPSERILHGLMGMLVEFVEGEARIVAWDHDPSLATAWEELSRVYLWWTVERPQRRDPWDDVPAVTLDLDAGKVLIVRGTDAEERDWQKAAERAEAIEERHRTEDTEMLVRVIALRHYLD